MFIDINTKQRPVAPQLLLDIKRLADIEDESEEILRDIFDLFDTDLESSLAGYMSPAEAAKNRITRVTFNSSVKPILEKFAGREADDLYRILNAYLTAIKTELLKKTNEPLLSRPVVFRAFIGMLPYVAQRVSDKFDGQYSPSNFLTVIEPMFQNMPMKKLESPGTSWVTLRKYLEDRLKKKMTL